MDNEHLSTYFTSEHMSELEDFLSEATQPVVVHAMAATVPVFGEGVNGEVAPVLENMDFCRNLCSWLDEEWTAASDASTTLDEPFSVNVEKTTGSHLEIISFCSDFCPWLDEDWTAASDAGTVPDKMPEEMPDEISPRENTPENDTTVFMKSLYRLGDILGTGSFGVTYKAIRKSDGKEVAIKRIRKRNGDRYISVPGYSKPVLREVAFMLMLKDPPKSIYLIEMYEWFDQEGFISLVLEYPKPCTSLRIFVKRRHTLKEPIARCLLHQLILGIQHSLDHGISHNDLHVENILVNTNTLELKVIDFGCASKCEDEEQRIIILGNIWSVGHLLYFMVNGKAPVYSRDEWQPRLLFKPKISSECCDLIEKCLNHNLETLEEVMQHEWMKKV
ncbi:serine/threonine-protein kinase pim-2-like isoform X4 [Danio rerio]|uniref:Serine/threonine-protein kinase pim-2-like isoform X4 n=1 Tax=Danio rerio TaxID=7955 RepID=A0AC58G9B7_DANRE